MLITQIKNRVLAGILKLDSILKGTKMIIQIIEETAEATGGIGLFLFGGLVWLITAVITGRWFISIFWPIWFAYKLIVWVSN